MIKAAELKRWLESLSEDADVAIDDGGLAIVELDERGNDTGAYLEIGGIPDESD